jgi:hypothetical protein
MGGGRGVGRGRRNGDAFWGGGAVCQAGGGKRRQLRKRAWSLRSLGWRVAGGARHPSRLAAVSPVWPRWPVWRTGRRPVGWTERGGPHGGNGRAQRDRHFKYSPAAQRKLPPPEPTILRPSQRTSGGCCRGETGRAMEGRSRKGNVFGRARCGGTEVSVVGVPPGEAESRAWARTKGQAL